MYLSPHPADISLNTSGRLAASQLARPTTIPDRHPILSRRRRTVALTVAATAGTLLVGLGLTFAVMSLAGGRALGDAPAVARIGAEPATSVLVSRILPVVAAVLVGGGLGWLRRSRPLEGW